jgi:hypothetical protein
MHLGGVLPKYQPGCQLSQLSFFVVFFAVPQANFRIASKLSHDCLLPVHPLPSYAIWAQHGKKRVNICLEYVQVTAKIKQRKILKNYIALCLIT